MFNFDNVKKVYIGKPNMCFCGCSGSYYYDTQTISKVVDRIKSGQSVLPDNSWGDSDHQVYQGLNEVYACYLNAWES